MTISLQYVLDTYKELLLEIDLLNFKKETIITEMNYLIAHADKERSFELIAEHQSIESTIDRLEESKIEFKTLLLSYMAKFKDKEIFIFTECFLKNKSCNEVSKEYDLSLDEVSSIYGDIKGYMEKEIIL